MRRVAVIGLVAAVVTVPAVTAAADDPPVCLNDLQFVIEGSTPGSDPVITGTATARTKVLHVDRGTCTDASITLRRTDGATRTAVLAQVETGPRYWGEYAWVDLPPGQWRVFEYAIDGWSSSGGIAPTFQVRYGSAVTADPIAPVTAPAASVVTGTVRTYAGGAATVADAGRRVEVQSHLLSDQTAPFRLAASAYTDSAGRFKITVPFTVNSAVDVVAPDNDRSARADAENLSAHVSTRFTLDAKPSRWPARTWVKVTGRTVPGSRGVVMTADTVEGSPTSAISAKRSAADGTFALYFPPSAKGGYILHAGLLPDPDNDGTPSRTDWRIDLFRATSLTGITAATSATVIRPGTRMSAYGHLRVTDGATTAYAAQKVAVQTRPVGGSAYTTVATASTSSSGYYYANWTARSDVDVRLAHLSTDRYTNSAYTFVRRVDVR